MDRHSVHSDPIGTGEFLFVKKKIPIIVAHAQKAIEGKKIFCSSRQFISEFIFLLRSKCASISSFN